jgi:hypothetical protein
MKKNNLSTLFLTGGELLEIPEIAI